MLRMSSFISFWEDIHVCSLVARRVHKLDKMISISLTVVQLESIATFSLQSTVEYFTTRTCSWMRTNISDSLVLRPRFPTAADGLHHRYLESGSGS